MYPASERYSTHVICFSQKDSFKHGEYTFHHTLDFTRTLEFTESYHVEFICSIQLAKGQAGIYIYFFFDPDNSNQKGFPFGLILPLILFLNSQFLEAIFVSL